MTLKETSVVQISNLAKAILRKEMGISNTIRFLHQYSLGSGDYTKERVEIFKDKDLDDIIAEIKQTRDKKEESID